MAFEKRLIYAKEALDLFIRSLPAGAKFSIVGFGTRWETLSDENDPECVVLTYNDETCRYALEKVREMKNNLGGTNILAPLTALHEDPKFQTGLRKRIFMLTDGAVSNPDEVIGYVRENRMKARHYSFGLGAGCD